MNSTSGIEVVAPTSATSPGSTAPPSSSIRSGIPQALPDGELCGVFRSPWASIHTTASTPGRAASFLDRADVGATAAAEDERPLRQVGGERERLLGERGLLDHRRLRIGQAEERRLGHGFTPFTPGAWDPDEAGSELAPARVALVLGADRDRRQRAAVGTAGAQATHADSARTGRSRNTVSR